MKIIAFTGLAGSGKSTAASIIEANMGAVRIPFAGVLKDAARVLFDLEDRQLYTQEGKAELDPRWQTTPRDMLQRLGTEAMRGTFGDDFWLRRWELEAAKHTERVVIVEDARFPNEADYLKAKGALVIGIYRGKHPATWNTEGWHDSERLMAENWSSMANRVVSNKGTVAELRQKLEVILKQEEWI